MRRGFGARSPGMKASQLSITRTMVIRRAAIATRSRRTVSTWNSCHMYGPTAAGQYVTPTSSCWDAVWLLTPASASVDEKVDASGDGEHLACDVARLG